MFKMAKKLKTGEKIMFGVFGAFVVFAAISFVILEVVRWNSTTPMYGATMHFDFSPEGHRGSKIYRESRCNSCHRAMRNGTNMGLSLDGLGSKRSQEWILKFLTEPESVATTRTLDHGAAPKEAAYVAKLPPENLHAISVFLSELRVDRGGASSALPPEGRSEFIDSMVKTWAPKEWEGRFTDVRKRLPEPVEPAPNH